MPSLVGLVYSADDPTRSPFRIIYPTRDDAEITDELCPCGCGELHWSAHLTNPALLIVKVGSAEYLDGLTASISDTQKDKNAAFAVRSLLAAGIDPAKVDQAAVLKAVEAASAAKDATPETIARAVLAASEKP